MAKTPLQELADHGQSVWIDYLSRPFVQDGDLSGLVDDGIEGVTSNPTIFQGAIAEGDAYDQQIREIVEGGESEPKEIFIALAGADIRDACDVLRRVYDEGDGKDGYVSFEVDPNLAHDTQATCEEAKRLHGLIDKPNLFIKIPATREGLTAIEETIAAGIPVNVTLIFSLERHREVAEAYVRGVQPLGLRDRALGVVCEVRIDLERHPAVARVLAGLVPLGAQDVAGGADVVDRDREEDLLGIGLRLEDLAELVVVAVALGDRRLEDGRVRRDAVDAPVDELLELTVLDEGAREVVDPHALACAGELVEGRVGHEAS